MSTSEERNAAHLDFLGKIEQQFSRELREAAKKIEHERLQQLIAVEVPEATILHLTQLNQSTQDDRSFALQRFEEYTIRMKGKMAEIGLPEEIFNRALQFGYESFHAENPHMRPSEDRT